MTTAAQPDHSAIIDWTGRIDEAVAQIRKLDAAPPVVGVVLGSGLGKFVERLENARALPFRDIPHFPVSSVVGHAGQLVMGTHGGVRVVAMAGRVHGYEGYSPQEVVFPIRVLGRLGVRALVLTNAAGCVNAGWQAGDLMRITDHINLSGRNPLIGPNDARLGARFPDLSNAYDRRLAAVMEDAAKEHGIALRAGVYAHLFGPSYETPAEIRMLRILGGDAVGMSTVPEVIAAAHMGIPVAGISCLTNMAAGILDQPLSHVEVTETAARVNGTFIKLLDTFLPRAAAVVGA